MGAINKEHQQSKEPKLMVMTTKLPTKETQLQQTKKNQGNRDSNTRKLIS